MRISSVLFLYFVACSLASCNGQDYIGKLAEASSKIAQEQYDRGIGYINGYNDANAKLTKVTVYLKTNYQDVLNMTIVEKFLNDIQSHVTNNVQQLIDKYHPVVIFGYITYYFNNFIGNIVGNNATLSGITEVYQLYGAKFLQPKSGECMRDFDSQLVSVFLNASSGFIKNMTASTSSTGSQLDILRNDIETTITQLIKTLDGIIADKSTAGKQFEDFIASNSKTIFDQIDGWIVQFNALMKQVQKSIRGAFKQFDETRRTETWTLIDKTKACLNAA